MTNPADDFLLGGGGKSASFETIGDSITGTIVSTQVTDQTDIATGRPLTWDDGSPRKQLVVKLQTSQRDDSDDDGIRSVYVKGTKKAGSRSLHDAVASAVRKAGAKSLEAGGTLTVTHDGTEPAQTRGFSDRKLYSATYAAPNQSAGFLGVQDSRPVEAGQERFSVPAASQQVGQVESTPATPEALAAFEQWRKSQQPA